MDAPPPVEDVRPFVRIAHRLLALGLSAPRILAADEALGFLLVEDLGDRRVGPELAAGRADEDDVYARAVDLLVHLQAHEAPPDLAPYDRAALVAEVMLFLEWYLPAAGIDADPHAFIAAWDEAWAEVLAETAAAPVLVLRDYHADNLMLLPPERAAFGLGLLDFQDALAGHPAYDLVSLLQDARRDVPRRLEARMIERFTHARGLDPVRFRAAYEVLGAQRNVKILGIFVRLRDRDGRTGYVERLPRVWAYLARNLAHPALAPVARWFRTHVPPAARAPWCEARAA